MVTVDYKLIEMSGPYEWFEVLKFDQFYKTVGWIAKFPDGFWYSKSKDGVSDVHKTPEQAAECLL